MLQILGVCLTILWSLGVIGLKCLQTVSIENIFFSESDTATVTSYTFSKNLLKDTNPIRLLPAQS